MIKKIWLNNEIEYLKTHYKKIGPKKCSEHLNRTLDSVKNKAKNLKLRYKGYLYEENSFTEIVKCSRSYSDVVKKLKLPKGHGNRQTTIKYIEKYNIDISHFDFKGDNLGGKRNKIPLNEILVENSTYTNRHNIKEKLYRNNIKERKCEIKSCGQGEIWKGRKMSLILDHINGVNNDHRIENLRIVCPNCNATLPTHCGKNK